MTLTSVHIVNALAMLLLLSGERVMLFMLNSAYF